MVEEPTVCAAATVNARAALVGDRAANARGLTVDPSSSAPTSRTHVRLVQVVGVLGNKVVDDLRGVLRQIRVRLAAPTDMLHDTLIRDQREYSFSYWPRKGRLR